MGGSSEGPWGSWGSLGALGEVLGGPRSLGSTGCAFLGCSLRSFGVILRGPARLAANCARFVGALGGPLEDPWGGLGDSLRSLGEVLGGPRSFGCTGCAFLEGFLGVPWGGLGGFFGPLSGCSSRLWRSLGRSLGVLGRVLRVPWVRPSVLSIRYLCVSLICKFLILYIINA